MHEGYKICYFFSTEVSGRLKLHVYRVKLQVEVQSAMTTNCIDAAVYSTYYKPMGDLSYISSEQGGGLIIHHGLIMRITIYKRPIPI